MDAPTLEHLFTITANTSLAAIIPNGPSGTRVIVDAATGTFEGPKLRGTVSGPAGDWVTMRADGSMLLDVRILLKTDDGADILMEYKGVGFDNGARITTAPLFQTGAEQYAWLNSVVAVAKGASNGTSVTYEVYAVD
jgi:Protein of unknown function (DUF3237)